MEFYRHYTMPVIPGFSEQEGQMPQYLLSRASPSLGSSSSSLDFSKICERAELEP